MGWRYIFVILIPVLLFTLILGINTIEEKHEPQKVPVDIPGIILIMLTFLGLVYGFANIAAFGQSPLSEIVSFVVGILALFLFIKHCKTCMSSYIIFPDQCDHAWNELSASKLFADHAFM